MKPTRFVFLAGLLLVLILFCSCDVYYSTPQPSWIKRNEKVIPEKFRGTFISSEHGALDAMDKAGKGDSVWISERRILIDKENDYNLSDSVILRKFKHNYYLNIYDREKNVWLVVLIKEMQNKIYYYMIPSEDTAKIASLKEITAVGNFEADTKYFLINPTRREFCKILKANLFLPQDTLTRLE